MHVHVYGEILTQEQVVYKVIAGPACGANRGNEWSIFLVTLTSPCDFTPPQFDSQTHYWIESQKS